MLPLPLCPQLQEPLAIPEGLIHPPPAPTSGDSPLWVLSVLPSRVALAHPCFLFLPGPTSWYLLHLCHPQSPAPTHPSALPPGGRGDPIAGASVLRLFYTPQTFCIFLILLRHEILKVISVRAACVLLFWLFWARGR